jgi:hypothetical protein
MASQRHTSSIAVFLDDLEATLQASDKAASHLERELAERSERQKRLAADVDKNIRQAYAVLAVSGALIEEAQRLRENVRAARETVKDVRRELSKVRKP